LGAFGEDIGQQGWQSADEQDHWLAWIGLHRDSQLLDIACGSGGPTLRIAERTGCRVHGVDFEAKAVAAAEQLVQARNLDDRAIFSVADASRPLNFAAGSFDAVVCIDAIGYLPDRSAVLAEWSRLLKPGGNVIFTDPLVVTGPLSSREVAIRSLNGFHIFVPRGYDEGAIASAGLTLVTSEDRTESVAKFAAQRLTARAARRETLVKIEGEESVDRWNEVLRVAAELASEKRLSRFLFHARKQS
jgi:ubiquinone/menaquinone biosynthesis C-methylase UbiE